MAARRQGLVLKALAATAAMAVMEVRLSLAVPVVPVAQAAQAILPEPQGTLGIQDFPIQLKRAA